MHLAAYGKWEKLVQQEAVSQEPIFGAATVGSERSLTPSQLNYHEFAWNQLNF
ncbi:MAG: hypothetical protein ICV55_04635 [Coleofasciculus sp. C3-bin4]|nr:hypothetical protein [Coleofasciculus sp. C3-bin4]